jgi:hypothetical protein
MTYLTRLSRPAAALLAALFLFVLAGCGDGDETSSSSTDATADATASTSAPDTSDPVEVADATAACLTGEGLEPSVVEGELEGAAGIDLTTRNRTIVVQVFASEEEAADYESASGLDQEVVGQAVILGGLVPPDTRQAIVGCLPAA